MIDNVLPEVYAESTKKELQQAAEDRSVVDLQKVFHDLTTTVVGHMAYDVRSPVSSSRRNLLTAV
jgi:hypothetical protein